MPPFAFTTFPELETDRLRLRAIGLDDAPAWLAAWNHPEVMRYLVDFARPTTDLAEVQDIIRWTQDIFAQQTGLRWAITRKPDPTLIGSCGFHLYSEANRCAEVGYELHPAHWHQGIMTEAMHAVLAFGFKAMALHRIEANVTVGNTASAQLLRRLGFSHEGTWRHKVFARGAFHDLWQFGLLEDEYPPQFDAGDRAGYTRG